MREGEAEQGGGRRIMGEEVGGMRQEERRADEGG